MKRFKDLSEAGRLEMARVALANAKTDKQFSIPLVEVGFSSESIEEGKKHYESARKAYNECQATKSKCYEMGKAFQMLKADLDEKFRIDWLKAQIVFKRDIVAKDKLDLNSPYPRTYLKWIESAKVFYAELSRNPDLAERLARRNYSSDDNEARLKAISEIEVARAAYIFEKGISQNATDIKAKALSILDQWMEEFFSLAKIAFRREPQLMESFGLVVKS